MNENPVPDFESATWRKSSYSQGQNNCVEIARTGRWVGVRDSKLGQHSPVLVFTEAEWAAFQAAVRDGEFHAN